MTDIPALVERLNAQAELYERDMGETEAAMFREAAAALTRLSREVDIFYKAGTIEVAVRNPSVMESMKHWEGRAEKAEAALAERQAHWRDEREKVAARDKRIAELEAELRRGQ